MTVFQDIKTQRKMQEAAGATLVRFLPQAFWSFIFDLKSNTIFSARKLPQK